MYCSSVSSETSEATDDDELLNHDKKIRINEELSKHYEDESSYYEEKANELEKELKAFGISFDELDTKLKSDIKSLAEMAIILNLKDPSLVNFHLALNHMAREKFKLTKEFRHLLQEEAGSAKLMNELKIKEDNFQRELHAMEKKNEAHTEESIRRKPKIDFLNSKMKEYIKKQSSLEEKLNAVGCQPSLYHSKLVKDYEEISLMETKLREIDAKLKSYHDLPPNRELAKLKLEEAKVELARLQELLLRKIEESQNLLNF